MNYGDEYAAKIPPGFDTAKATLKDFESLFRDSTRFSCFDASADGNFVEDFSQIELGDCILYKINKDCLFDITNHFVQAPYVLRNRLEDVITFQFVSSVKRLQFYSRDKHVHDLGPALIVSAVSKPKDDYRLPEVGKTLRHVMLHTTLSNLMERMGETADDYPDWLRESLAGRLAQPVQRLYYLEEMHRDLIWPCFNLPVQRPLLDRWLSAKYEELLCVGLQILKSYGNSETDNCQLHTFPGSDTIRQACGILDLEYANPPRLAELAKQLAISETELKVGFKRMYGTTILQYCIGKRVESAKLLLQEQKLSVAEIAETVGYEDHSAFSRVFKSAVGSTPSEFQNNYASYKSPILHN